jgi:hypothetical protein
MTTWVAEKCRWQLYNKITSIKPSAFVGLLICYMYLINIWNMKHTRHKSLAFLHTDRHRNLQVLVYRQTQKSSCSCIQTDTEIFTFLYTDTKIFMFFNTDRHRNLHILLYRQRNLHVLLYTHKGIFTFLYTATDIFMFL